jgi:spermidine synthase
VEKTRTFAGWGFALTAVLFVASGFSSLIYQVVWTRMLVLVFGSTTFATSTVLAVFMGGLALGSFVAGRVSDKIKRPFFYYGVLEGVIGLWALLVPFLFAAAVPLYQVVWQGLHPTVLPFSLLRFMMAAVILILPTACMGATLPLLSRFVTASLDYVGERVGTLYSVNTLGAVAGAMLAGFGLLPALGLSATTLIAALINFLICGLVIWLAPMLEHRGLAASADSSAAGQQPEDKPAAAPLSRVTRLAIISFGISGAAAMIYEVGWTRTLLMVIGSSNYAFTIMLSTFLIGIFLGSFVCARIVDRARDPLAWFAKLEIGVFFFGFMSMALFNYLPWWNLQLNAILPADPTASICARFVLASLILSPLTFCLGAIFPTIVKASTKELEAVGKSVGTLYSINTLGAIIGAFTAGFILVPWLGVERTLIVASVVNLVLGVGLCLCLESIPKYVRIAMAIVSLPVLYWCLGMPDIWNRSIMLMAQSERRRMVRSALTYQTFDKWRTQVESNMDYLFWKDGASSTVGIMRWKDTGSHSLVTNGHVDASDGMDKNTQILLSAYPLLWKPDAKDVAVIGWGSGMTLGTASLFPVKSITAIELEPAVIEASKFFHRLNHYPEKNPLVHLEVNDGRNYMLATDKKFDAILSEPSNPWQAGVCNLFTKEYFQVCRQRLNSGGIFAFWLQTVEIPPENLREILSALRSVFPYTFGLNSDRTNVVVLASDQPLKLDFDRLKAAFKSKALAKDLAEVDINSPEALLARVAAASDGIEEMTRGFRPNVDDTNRLEFAVGRTYENRFFMNEDRQLFVDFCGNPWQDISFGAMTAKQKAASLAEIGRQALLIGANIHGALWAQASVRVEPSAEAYRVAGIAAMQEGEEGEAQKLWAKALEIDPKNIDTLQTRGVACLESGQIGAARADFAKVLAIEPENKPAQLHMAQTFSSLQQAPAPNQKSLLFLRSVVKDQSPETVVKYLEPLAGDPKFVNNHPETLLLLGQADYQLGQIDRSEALLRRFVVFDPESVAGQRLLGCLAERRGFTIEAAGRWYRSIHYAKQAQSKLWRMANEELKAGRQTDAVRLLINCLELCPDDQQVYLMLGSLSKQSKEAAEKVTELMRLGYHADETNQK